MSDRKVKVESTVKYAIVVSMPDFRFNRTFTRENQSSLVDYEVMEEGLQRPGFRNLFLDGKLRVVEKKDRIDLGLESADADDEIEPIISLTTKDIIGKLKGDEQELKDILKAVNEDLLRRFVQVAITSKITDYKVINAINEESKNRKFDIDMTALMKLASDAERPVNETAE
jgi:hypothetical protein